MVTRTPSLRDAIAERLCDPEDVVLARDILGTIDPDAIARQVEAFVPGVTGCPLFIQSVGAVFVLDVTSGERLVLKVHAYGSRPRNFETLAELEAVYAAQDALATSGMPCARVLASPRRFSPGRAAAIMSYLDVGPIDDPHAPTTAPALAATAAEIRAQLGGDAELRVRLAGHNLPVRTRLPATLFPPAHNALFDLHGPGGEWIDERARRARAVLETGVSPAAMHSDVSCANLRVVDGRVAAVFDVDSLCLIDEPRCVASMAVHFTYTGDAPLPSGEPAWAFPSRDEARAFVAAYEAARGTPFDRSERARLDAGAIYALAYTSRCEVGHSGERGMCAELRAAPDAYFSG